MIPMYYLVVCAFKNQQQILEHPLGLPASFSLENYMKALASMDYWRNFGNSLLITSVSIIIVIVFGSMAAYSISRHKTKLSKAIGALFLIGFMDWSMMMPALVLALLPMVVFYLFMQRQIVEGVVSGAVKG